ncbi:AlpA family transcriptional regulator [Luteibacter sp. 3190]|uniref:helix-turn-helix transcriptional regulator n=1 Tax=Luteibacter sp. 3190 TaxID=2817736 RepID=UPI00286CB182|nr:AlpA family transcriptional regulator [Luteibacter sp. 3190]
MVSTLACLPQYPGLTAVHEDCPMSEVASGSPNSVAADAPIQFLRLPTVCARTGLSRSQVYRLEAEGRFPRRVKLALSTSAWVESEIQRWSAERIAASRGGE